MSVEIRDDRFRAVVGEKISFERLGTGFVFTEGAAWHPRERHLVFSDIPNNRLHRWSGSGGIESFRQPSNKANGNTYDRAGRLLSCEHTTSHVTRTASDGIITVVASHYQGKELNSPNDIVVKSDGWIYFTDPTYGRSKDYGLERPLQLDFRGVYRVREDGSALTLLAGDFGQPNGLCFSGDETRLFVNDTERGHIRAFDVKPDGTLAGGGVWAEVARNGKGAPDGMKIDSAGNLYCCDCRDEGGLHIFAPDARLLGIIRPPEATANFTWGDDDMKSLFLTASTSLYRMRSNTPGVALF